VEKQKFIFNKPITDIIKSRISVRTYEPQKLDESTKKNLSSYLENLKGPFAGKVRFKRIDSTTALNSNIKLGTYGIIRGASSYVASAIEKSDMNLVELGYELESFVLYAASLGLGTCWMGGTFKKGEFARAMELKEEELLPIVTPIGYPAKNEGLVGTMMRRLAGSRNRKPWDELFFDGSFNKKLTQGDANTYSEALEMVRLAPSASNKQPWRIVKEMDKLHFYLQHTKGYSSALGFDMQRIDIGIAMCHLDLALKEAGIEGVWEKNDPGIKGIDDLTEYIVTWSRR
jgi:hypothetical protein